MAILSEQVQSYLAELRPPRSRVMAEMEELAEREGIPIVQWETGRMLAALAGSLDPRVLEVGTAIGYSALHMAEALDTGSVVTLERDPQRIDQAGDFLGRAGVAGKVEIVEGDAHATIPGLEGPFGLLFLDATKGEYGDYLELAEPLLAPRALLVVDNLLMSGDVADPDAGGSARWPLETVEAGRAFNQALLRSQRWRGAVLPVGDGVGLATRIG
ncbi:O-methyltransferase [soil metagenome]